jgi:hypothetical protein
MGELDTYSLIDLMPMEPEVYFRLFVRQNQGVWPLQVLTVGLALVALWLAWRGRGRPVAAIVGLATAWVGYSFFLDMYAELNWAAEIVGWAFVGHGAVSVAYAAVGRFEISEAWEGRVVDWAGVGLVSTAVVVLPILVGAGRRGWDGIDLFGAAPDSTALAAMGFVLLTRPLRWELFLIPLAWCLYSGVTWWAMGWHLGLIVPALALTAVVVAAVETVRPNTSDQPSASP